MWPAIGAVVAAGANFLGGERSNRINQREARLNREFQAAEAATNRAFQREMRSTEWQAAVSDMEAAGINPAVAYARGGASSPGGSMAGGATAAPAENTVSSALQALAMRKQLKLLDEQISKTRSEASSAASDASMKFVDQKMAMQRYDFYFGPDGRPKGPLLELLAQTHRGNVASSARSVSEAELAKFSIPERQAIARVFESLGGAGKGAQMFMPILLELMRR